MDIIDDLENEKFLIDTLMKIHQGDSSVEGLWFSLGPATDPGPIPDTLPDLSHPDPPLLNLTLPPRLYQPDPEPVVDSELEQLIGENYKTLYISWVERTADHHIADLVNKFMTDTLQPIHDECANMIMVVVNPFHIAEHLYRDLDSDDLTFDPTEKRCFEALRVANIIFTSLTTERNIKPDSSIWIDRMTFFFKLNH